MFERFTQSAQKILDAAVVEALRSNSGIVCSEHLVIGLLLEGTSEAKRQITKSQISLDQVRSYLENVAGSNTSIDSRPRWTSNATKILESSWSSAKDFHHDRISPDHIILALLQHDQGLALNVLRKFDIDVSALICTLSEYLRQRKNVENCD